MTEPAVSIDPRFLLLKEVHQRFLAEADWPGLSVSTRVSYTSGLNTLLREIQNGRTLALRELTVETVDAAFVLMASRSPTRYSQVRGGWERFRTWVIATYDLMLPSGPRRRKRGPDRMVPIEVGEALYRLISEGGVTRDGVTRRVLLRARWDEIKPDPDSEAHWFIPIRRGTLVPMSAKDAVVVWNYAKGDGDRPLGPFVPSEAGGDTSVSWSTLQRVVADARERVLRERAKTTPTKTEAATDRAALDDLSAAVERIEAGS